MSGSTMSRRNYSVGSIKRETLSGEDLEMYETLIANTRPLIAEICQRIYGSNSPRQFRADYFTGKLQKSGITRSQRADIEILQSTEVPLLQHNVGMIWKIAHSYYIKSRTRLPGVMFDDFFQEACMCLSDCVYSYDGNTKFVTYLAQAVNNRLKDFIRIENPLSPLCPKVIALTKIVSKAMKLGKTFDEAAEEAGLTVEEMQHCQAAFVRVHSEATFQADDGSLVGLDERVVAPSTQLPKDYDEAMMEAFLTADLSEIERAVFARYLEIGRGAQVEVAKSMNKTRAAASYAYERAVVKVRKRYLELAPSEAEALQKAA